MKSSSSQCPFSSKILGASVALLTGNNVVIKDGTIGKLEVPPGQVCAWELPFAPEDRDLIILSNVTLQNRLVYLPDTPMMGFHEAKAACEAAGGVLPMIRNQEELQIVLGRIK